MSTNITRQGFLKGAAATAVAAASMGMATSANAAGLNRNDPAEKPSFFTNPYNNKAEDAAKVYTSEVVIVGAGNAGCAAASALVDNGVQVIVVEQQAKIHGQGGGVGMANTKFVKQQVEEGNLDHITDVVQHQNIWIQRCGSRVNEALVSMWFNYAPIAGDWLIDKSAEYGVFPASFRSYAPNAIVPETYDYHFFRSDMSYNFYANPRCGWFAPANVCYVDSIDAEKHANPATFVFEAKAQDLLVENGEVKGVFAVKNGELLLFKATKGVILSTGGIHEDPEMCAYYCDDYVNRVQRCEHSPAGFSTGDGHKMGLWAGAKMQDSGPFPLMLHPQACSMFHGAFLFVNTLGKRFMNEGAWVQGKSMNIMNQPGYIAYSIFDANYGEYNRISLEGGTGGGMFWDSMSGALGAPFTDTDLDGTVASDLKNGNTVQADTLEELAALIGVPEDEFLATVARYNEMAAKQFDDDYHKPVEFISPIEEPPFYAAKIGVSLLAIVGGLSVDTNLQVLNNDLQPIKGLYASGNTSGDTYAIDYPINCAGNSNGRCIIWGYRLGEVLAGVEGEAAELTPLADLAADFADPVAEA